MAQPCQSSKLFWSKCLNSLFYETIIPQVYWIGKAKFFSKAGKEEKTTFTFSFTLVTFFLTLGLELVNMHPVCCQNCPRYL